MPDEDVARAVESLNDHQGRLLCWRRPSSGEDEYWWQVVGSWDASAKSPSLTKFKRQANVTVVNNQGASPKGFRNGGHWFYVGSEPKGLAYQSAYFLSNDSVDIKGSLKVAQPAIRAASHGGKRERGNYGTG